MILVVLPELLHAYHLTHVTSVFISARSTPRQFHAKSDRPASSTAKPDILVCVAQVKELFVPNSQNMAIDNARLDRPPSYEATTQSPPPEDAPKKVSALVAHEGFGDEKGTLHKEKMASNPVMNSTYATGEKPPGIAGESG